MKYVAAFAILALTCIPSLRAQSTSDHIEVGVFADYLNLSRTSPHINYVGLGGRVGFNVQSHVQIEAEMSYDFARNYTSTFYNGVNTQFVRSSTRPLTGLFGPKFETNAGPFRAFVTVKAGFINFSTSNQNASSGFVGSLGAVTSGDTRAAFYPGAGLEGFWGPFGLRADVGDDMYFDNGARHNVKASIGPVFRF
jgi:hypothetical protein